MSFLRESPLDETLFEPFLAFRRSLGFVPNLFRAQTLRPDVVQAETDLYAAIDLVSKKIEQQIRKRHSKSKARKHTEAARSKRRRQEAEL